MTRRSLKTVAFRFFGFYCPGRDQDGSIILIVLMILVLMSIIGVASTNTTVVENFMVRNTALRKQNLHLADAAAMEVVQQVLDAGLDDANSLELDDILPNMPAHETWVNDKDSGWEGSGGLYESWYNPADTGHLLNSANSEVPLSIQDETNGIQLLNIRGEANESIRYALVGWEFKTGGSTNLNLMSGQPILRTANILTEYMSEDNGVIRLTVGVERAFPY